MPSGGLAQVVVEGPAAVRAVPRPITLEQPVAVAEEEEEPIPADDARFLFHRIVSVLEGKVPAAPAAPAPAAPRVVIRGAGVRVAPAAPPAAAAPQAIFLPAIQGAEPLDDVESLFQGIVDALEGINDPNIRNLEAQFLPQFQQVLYSELAFLRRACEPDAAQFRSLAQSSRRSVRDALRQYVVAQVQPQRNPIAVPAGALEPQTFIQQQLVALVESKLSPEQAKRYREESDQRAASRKHAVVLNLASRIDEQLVLSAEQREKLVQTLASDYQDAWSQWLELQVNNPQFFPEILDSSVVPLLNAKQKAVWQQMPKQNFHFFGVVQFGGGAGMVNAAEFDDIRRLVEEVKDGE
jgi:hypothetical protein